MKDGLGWGSKPLFFPSLLTTSMLPRPKLLHAQYHCVSF